MRDELVYPVSLVEWSKRVGDGMFVSSGEQDAVKSFAEMQAWVRRSGQFTQAASDEFARVADGWLAAYAKVHDMILVTHETLKPDAKRRVPLPNVCDEFEIDWKDTFDVLRELGVRFEWRRHLGSDALLP